MKRSYWLFALALAVGFCALTGAARAQATRTWVSGVGDDANPCSRTAPCKTFAGAISKTANCGEIDALDPGGFGALTITKSITIDGGGGQVASSLVTGTAGFSISNQDTVCRLVTIRNMRFNGLGAASTSSNGILVNTNSLAGAVNLENVYVGGFQACVNVNATAAQLVTITNSVLEYCSANGVTSTSTVATTHVNIVNTMITSSGVGVATHANTDTLLQGDSVVDNTIGGVLADTNSTAKMDIDRSSVANNLGYGVQSTAGAFIGLSNTVVTFNNGQGLFANGGTIVTWSNNYVAGNNPDGTRSGTLTPM